MTESNENAEDVGSGEIAIGKMTRAQKEWESTVA